MVKPVREHSPVTRESQVRVLYKRKISSRIERSIRSVDGLSVNAITK